MSHENVSHHIAAFEELIGREAILRSVDELAAYQTPARGSAGRAFAVARPASTKQLSDLIAYCAKENIHVVPQGANTGLVEGSTPNNQPASLVVSSERLNNVLEIDPLERTARVSAGVRLSQINAAAEKFGLFFPIDLGADPTIGGMLATNTGGARFICYGGVRENTLAVTAVLGNKQGSVTEFGKGLRKDNSSIDFKQILIGSGGAYAFICECILSLAVIPRRRQTALLVPSNDDVIIEILRRAELEFGPSLSAFEFMSAAAMRAALSHQTSLRDPFSGNPPEHALLIETASTQPLREGEISTDSMGLQQFCIDLWSDTTHLLLDARFPDAQTSWNLRHSLSEGGRAAGDVIAFDLSLPRSEVFRFRREAQIFLQQEYPELELADFGHVGDGGLHFNLIDRARSLRADNRRLQALSDKVIEMAVVDFRGSFSGEHGLGRKNQRYYDRYTPHSIKALSALLTTHMGGGFLGVPKLNDCEQAANAADRF